MKNKILFFLVTFFFASIVNAGLVPGTIQKDFYTSSITCNSSTSPGYSPTGGGCVPACSRFVSCNTGYPNYADCSYTAYDCTVPSMSGNMSFINYLYNYSNPTFSLRTGNIKISNDLNESCNKWADGTQHTPPSLSGTVSCSPGSASYYVGGNSGICNSFGSTDNLISSFDQLGNVSRTTPSDNDSSCTVEGRYAISDTTAPSITGLNGVKNVFNSNEDMWCNMNKYLENGDYEYFPEQNPGCEYYRLLNTTGNPLEGEDLLKGLEITIGSDYSGIGEVEIQLGTCHTLYTPDNSSLSNIIYSPDSDSGVLDTYTFGFTIKYDQSVNFLGRNQESLLNSFDVNRLDECLGEGRNSLVIVTKDMARSTSDGISLSANVSSKNFTSFINIDNSTPVLQLDGDLSVTDLGTTDISGFNGTIIDNTLWRNFTLEGEIKQGDKYEGGVYNECISSTGTGQCLLDKPTNGIFIAPNGVNSDTGVFPLFGCEGINKSFPSISDCKIGCDLYYSLDTNTNECVLDLNYCIAGNTVGCIVKEEGTSIVVAEPVNGICGAASGICNSGTLNWLNNTTECGTIATWECVGIDGGTTSSCNYENEACVTSCNEPDITVGDYTISACNVGTNIAGLGPDSFGYHFQFGRNSSYEEGTWTNSISSFADWSLPGGTDNGSANNWGVEDFEKLTATYSNQNPIDQAKMQGPCESGYHVPTSKEWEELLLAGGWTDSFDSSNVQTKLLLPEAGYYVGHTGVFIENIASINDYWTSSPDNDRARHFMFDPFSGGALGVGNGVGRAQGLPIRCFKNNDYLTGWRLLDTNCDIDDVTIGTQTWAGCNSTLGNGFEYSVDQGCYNYLGGFSSGCNRPSNEKENIWNSTYGIDNIWGKLYTWTNSASACPTGRHVPSAAEFTIVTDYIIDQNGGDENIGWKDHVTKNDTNNLVNALKIPLAGAGNSNGVIGSFGGRGDDTYLWTSTFGGTYTDGDYAHHWEFPWNSIVERDISNQVLGFSVRCIKGEAPVPVNGVCGSTAGTCTTGSLNWIKNTIECGTTATWECLGINGGLIDSCSYQNTACEVIKCCSISSPYSTEGCVKLDGDLNILATKVTSSVALDTSFESLKFYFKTIDKKAIFQYYDAYDNSEESCSIYVGKDQDVKGDYLCVDEWCLN